MTQKEKAIKVIIEIRKQEEEAYKQAKFCREHKFMLEASKFDAIEASLRKVCRILENEFETGYISIHNQ